MRHRAATPLLQWQTRLRPVKRLDLAVFIDGQDNGMGRWRDVKPHHIMEFLGGSLVVGEFETAPSMRCQPMLMPDLDHGRGRDTNGLRHGADCPVRRLLSRRLKRQCDDPLNQFAVKRSDAGRPALVAQEPIDTLGHKALVAAPDAGLGFASRLHDRKCTQAIASHQDDLRPPDILLRRTAVRHDIAQSETRYRILAFQIAQLCRFKLNGCGDGRVETLL